MISVSNLSRFYGREESLVRAVDHISLSIDPGEFTAIVGPSGSGKTTLLQLIGGLDRPQEGEIRLNGRAIQTMSERELSNFRRDHIGFVFQAFNLIPVLTVEENIEYVMLLQGLSHEVRRQRIASILEEVGLERLGKRRPGELSGGQQQRVAVARAMVTKPDIILADEPTANLDSHTGGMLLDMMKELNERDGMTFVFSTHDPKIMERAKRLIHLQDGKVVDDESR